MRKARLAALWCACLLALCGRALGDDTIVTFAQPEGVDYCMAEDIGYFPAPAGLQPMYTLAASVNQTSTVYVFIMPSGRALMSVACTDVPEAETAQALMERWPQIADALKAERLNAEASDARVENRYGFDALCVSAAMPLEGDRPLAIRAEGVAFYRERELIELWTLYPQSELYADDPDAQRQWEEDQAALYELQTSLSFGAPDSLSSQKAASARTNGKETRDEENKRCDSLL